MDRKREDPPQLRFAPVANRTLRQEVLEPLRNAILFGRLPVGERLIEAEIAEQMGVSRVPVREALRQLEHEGLLVSYPHRGTMVAAVDEDEVDQLYHLRAELEGYVLDDLMRQGVSGLVQQLQKIVDDMRAAVKAGNLLELGEKDLEFHQSIVSRSRYRILALVWSSMDGPIRARMYRILNGPFQHDLTSYTAESHQPVVDGIASGNAEVAVATIKKHIVETRDLLEKGVR